MNANEVLANAIELLHAGGAGSGKRGDYAVCSPNDHVNMPSRPTRLPDLDADRHSDLVRDFMPAAEN